MTGAGACAAILLAAGASSRFGGDKLAAVIDGETVLARSAKALADAGCSLRAAVVSEQSAIHAPLLKTFGYAIVANPHADEGLSASLREGVAWAEGRGAASVLIALADMPFVTPEHLRSLVHNSQQSDRGAAFTRHGARRSAPAAFHSTWFGELRALEGDEGARKIISRLPLSLGVEAPEAMLRDIDAPEDLRNLRNAP